MVQVCSYKELKVWQKAMDAVDITYQWTATFPAEERFGLISQMRRAAVSIPSNIAEGKRRQTRKDFASFLDIALGSASELETQCEIARRRSYGNMALHDLLVQLLGEISAMLYTMINRLRSSSDDAQRKSSLHPVSCKL